MTLNFKEAWDDSRPVYKRLPIEGFQNNEVVDWLTQQPDADLMSVKQEMETFYQKLDPVACPVAMLDYLGYLVGMSGEYWDLDWSEAVKRSMITNSFTFWENLGTLQTFTDVLDIHGLTYRVWQPGLSNSRVYTGLPLTSVRNGAEWVETQRTVRNFLSVTTRNVVSYDQFYIGFSVIGEPVFDPIP